MTDLEPDTSKLACDPEDPSWNTEPEVERPLEYLEDISFSRLQKACSKIIEDRRIITWA